MPIMASSSARTSAGGDEGKALSGIVASGITGPEHGEAAGSARPRRLRCNKVFSREADTRSHGENDPAARLGLCRESVARHACAADPRVAGALWRPPCRDRSGSDPYPMTASHAPTPAIPECPANPAPATMVPAMMGRRAMAVPPAVLRPVRLRAIGKRRDDVVQGRIRCRRRGGSVLCGQACRKPGSCREHRKQKRSSVHNRDTPCSLWISDTRRAIVVRASYIAFVARLHRKGWRPSTSMLARAKRFVPGVRIFCVWDYEYRFWDFWRMYFRFRDLRSPRPREAARWRSIVVGRDSCAT